MIKVLMPTFLLFITCVLQRCQCFEHTTKYQSAESFDLNSKAEWLVEFYENVYSLLPFSEFLKIYNSQTEIGFWKTEIRLSTINAKNYISEILQKSSTWLKDYILTRRMQNLITSIEPVQHFYEEYIKLRKDFKTRRKGNSTFSNDVYGDYIHKVFRSNMYGVEENLDEIKFAVTRESIIEALFTMIKVYFLSLCKIAELIEKKKFNSSFSTLV